MTEEIADSGSEGIDMDAAMDTITNDIFDAPPVVETKSEEVVEEVIEEVVEEEVKEEVKVNELPQSWKKEMQEKWEGVDPETQEYFLQRENQMREGLEKDRTDAVLGRTMRDVMNPYSETLAKQNINEADMVRNLMSAHMRISTADEAGRRDLINQLAQSYGVNLNGETPNPELKSMQDRLNGMESYISSSQQEAQQARAEKVQQEVEAFASEHELFDEVSEQIIQMINAGQDLETAYQNAIWTNPVTRQKEIDRQAKEATEKSLKEAKKEAEKARKAKSTNVRGRDTNKTPTEPTGSWEDTMRDTYREINSN